MRFTLEEKFNAAVKKELLYEFNISENGLYLVEVSARAKSWLQNTLKLISFFKDDDLAVKIDGREFPKISGKRGVFDSEAAWNGNKLKNLQQINVFVTYLHTGSHSLHFIADQSPHLETVKIYQAESEKDIVFEPAKDYQIESGNRRPWLVFILIDLALKRLKIQASANQKQSDDDDLQLKIDGERQINNSPKSHKYWFWCGRVLRGKSRIFDKKVNLPAGLHYIELWTDNVPNVDQIIFVLEGPKLMRTEGEVGRIALYRDITPERELVNLRERPNTASKVLKQIPNQARIMIVRQAVIGEPLFDDFLSDLWYEVLYRGLRGFVHSSLIEIRGQEREKIVEAIKTKAQELDIDEKFALNLSHCESKWLPFAHSERDYKGIYQLGKDAIQDINEKYGGDVSDAYNAYENIDGGLRYLKFLLKRYANSPDSLIRTIVAWNVGYTEVPLDDSFRLENYRDPETKRLLHCTLEERRGENTSKYLKILLLPLIISIGLWSLFTSDHYKNLNAEERHSALAAQVEISYLDEGENFVSVSPSGAREREVEEGYLQTDLDGDGKFEKIVFAFYSPEPFVYHTNIHAPDEEKIIVDGSLWKAFVDDLTGDSIKELIVTTLPGHISITHIFSYKNGHLEKIPIYYEDGTEAVHAPLGTSYTVRFEDLDDDGIKEIIHPVRNYGNEFIEPIYYYRWNGRGFMLYDKQDIKKAGRFKG